MLGLESEMVLDSNHQFRCFFMRDTTPWGILRGSWESHDGMLVWKNAVVRNSHGGFDFDYWEKYPIDTSYLRGISDSGFERLEISVDTQYFQLVRWVKYRRMQPLPKLNAGRYEFTETYQDYFDSAHSTGMSYVELTSGTYRDGRVNNGIPVYEFESTHWFQSGSFLIMQNSRSRSYDTATKSFSTWDTFPAAAQYEYVVRLRDIQSRRFQQWVPIDMSYQGAPYWVTWQRVTL